MNSKSLTRLAFHGFVTVMYFCALVRYEYLPPMPHKRSHEHYAGRWKYLTYWNLIAQFIFFALSSIIDVMKSSSSSYHKLTRFRDKMYAGIAMPYAVYVFAVFWILYFVDRELIFPKVLDAVFPAWLNHVSHTVILPVLFMETYLVRHCHPPRKLGVTITASFGILYITWVLYLALVKDIWPYPILQILNWGQRGIFFGCGIVFLYILYFLGEKVNVSFWGEGIVKKSK
ncbi:androgen-induced gene 1 protein-like [Uloborus diversus]|uniref:androgen-induced gene 1 protein-like n=1 Tax=Uloborus diversus TaxID=327109 RepID=UPI00240A0BAB|nr:androgen-induced gene 1 protein-like [Uloborus diversus]XP_054708094.1 androgen-induced gene 1 protein-like [Uloborus diversus]